MLFFFFFYQAAGLKYFIVVSSYDQATLVNILTIRPLHFVQTRIPACDHIVILLTLLLITCQRERELCVCVEMLDMLDSTLPDQNYWGQWMETMKVINWQNNLFCRPKFVKQITFFRCMYEKWKVGSNFLYNIRKELARNYYVNLSGSINRELNSINRSSCKFFFVEFSNSAQVCLTCRVLCFALSIKGKTLATF